MAVSSASAFSPPIRNILMYKCIIQYIQFIHLCKGRGHKTKNRVCSALIRRTRVLHLYSWDSQPPERGILSAPRSPRARSRSRVYTPPAQNPPPLATRARLAPENGSHVFAPTPAPPIA